MCRLISTSKTRRKIVWILLQTLWPLKYVQNFVKFLQLIWWLLILVATYTKTTAVALNFKRQRWCLSVRSLSSFVEIILLPVKHLNMSVSDSTASQYNVVSSGDSRVAFLAWLGTCGATDKRADDSSGSSQVRGTLSPRGIMLKLTQELPVFLTWTSLPTAHGLLLVILTLFCPPPLFWKEKQLSILLSSNPRTIPLSKVTVSLSLSWVFSSYIK